MSQLPSIPFVISEVLNAVDNENLSAKTLANLIERDQGLTAKVLRVANSPFYGFARRISTIDLAIVILGLNTIKEIVLSLLIQRMVVKTRTNVFDLKQFWTYSVFCGAASRVLARKMDYRLAGEAFVAGLMHDVGYLIIAELFPKEFKTIRELQSTMNYPLIFFENKVIGNAHTEIGEWFADKWNLPPKICEAINYHHSDYLDVIIDLKRKKEEKLKDNSERKNNNKKRIQLNNISTTVAEDNDNFEQQLTVIVALSEWLAFDMGFKSWTMERTNPNLFLAESLIDDFTNHDVLNEESALEILKQEIMEEFAKAATLSEVNL